MLYKLKKKMPLTSTECRVGPEVKVDLNNIGECGFSKKQIEFLKENVSNIGDFDIINMAEEGKPPAAEGTKPEEGKESPSEGEHPAA